MIALAAAAATGVTGPAPEDVTPGLTGFLVTFGLALAVILLMRSFVVHLRRVNFNVRKAELEERLAQEDAARAAAEAADPGTRDADGGDAVEPDRRDSTAP